MKHLLKQLISLTIILSLLLSSVYAFDAVVRQSSQDITKAERAYLEKLGEMQRYAAEAHDILYNSFLIAGSDIEHYPDNFGGDYIDGDTLHVLIVDLPNQDTTYYESLLHNYMDYIVFENANYSLQSLCDSANKIANTLIDDDVPVTTYGADIKKNCISIGIEESYSFDVEFSKSLQFDNPTEKTIPISFCSEPRTSVAVELINGSALRGYTLGVCGTYQGSNAIGLCGHGLSVGGSIRNESATAVIGSVNVQQYNSDENGDYAIAKITNASYTTAGLVGDPNSSAGQWYVTGASNRPAVGTSIIKYGKNGGFAYGTVENNNCTWNVSGGSGGSVSRRITGMVKVKLSRGEVLSGDSGGPNFSSYGVIFGTTSSQSSTPNSDGYYYFLFSPYLYLNNKGFVVKTYE